MDRVHARASKRGCVRACVSVCVLLGARAHGGYPGLCLLPCPGLGDMRLLNGRGGAGMSRLEHFHLSELSLVLPLSCSHITHAKSTSHTSTEHVMAWTVWYEAVLLSRPSSQPCPVTDALIGCFSQPTSIKPNFLFTQAIKILLTFMIPFTVFHDTVIITSWFLVIN